MFSLETSSGRKVFVSPDGLWDWDVDALVAACTSKACAPPPVGTGGSISSGTATAKRWTEGEATVKIAPKSPVWISTDMIKGAWPRTQEEVMKLLGDREAYPDDFRVSDVQAVSIDRISGMWIGIGSIAVKKLRQFAGEVLRDGIDRVINDEVEYNDDPNNRALRWFVAHTIGALKSAPMTTVWRGLRVSQETLDQWKVGGIYNEPLATATGRRTLATNFARGKFGSVGQKRSGNLKVLLKMKARNIPVGGSETGTLVELSDERFVSGQFRVVSVELVRGIHLIEVEQIDD